MKVIVPIVEGDGEVTALPVLLRRIWTWLSPTAQVNIASPIRVRRAQFINKDQEFRRILLLAAAKSQEDGWILIVLDADDDCPAEFSAQILNRVKEIVPHRQVSVVLANREFEAWFIAAAESLHTKRGFEYDLVLSLDAENIRGAKEWMANRMTGGKYRETTDQPAFSSLIDLQQTHDNSRSFRKLCKEWTENVTLVGQI